jgi:hypothetical protein
MTWVDKKQSFQDEFDRLNQKENEINTLITDLNTAIATFVKQAGLSQDPTSNPHYETIKKNLDELKAIKKEYKTL